MRKAILCAAVIGGLALAAIPANALDNTGFELPDKGDTGFEYAPAGASWTFSAKAGLSGPNGPWKCDSTSPDPLGNQFAYLQYDATVSQELNDLEFGGTYDLSFFESYRIAKASGNDLSVILDRGLATEVTIYSNTNINNNIWALRQTDQFVAAKSSYTLTFRSTYPLGVGDCTTIIDGVELTLINPPPSILFLPIANDADCGISAFKNYTHKLDFGTGTPGALVNGLQFDAYNLAANGNLNFSRAISSGTLGDHAGNPPPGVSGNLATLMRDMYYNNSNVAGGTTTWTLSGLTAGVTYDTRIYVRQWDANPDRRATLVFDPDGAGSISDSTVEINEDNATTAGMTATNDAYYINYRFTAVNGEDLVITATQHVVGNSWHLYGITSEQVGPTVKTLSPADNTTGVFLGVNLVATFEATIQKGTGNITLKRSHDDSVVETFDVTSAAVTVSDSQVILNPASDLAHLTGYYVEIDAGAIEDHAGRGCPGITGNSVWNFTTLTDLISVVPIANDADCGISAFKNYTHKLDFGTGTPGALINGLQFDAYTNAANGTLNFSRTVSTGTLDNHAGNPPPGISGNLVTLMTDMYYNGSNIAGGTTTWTLSGLTPGAIYNTRIYVRQWAPGNRIETLVFDPDGAGPISDSMAQVNEDDATSVGMTADDDAYYISYLFKAVAGENLVITVTQHLTNASWHLYGLTNEIIPPEGTVFLIQ